jgi:hypothetical protein
VEDFKKYEDLQIALKQAFGLLMEFYILKETPQDDFTRICELFEQGLKKGFMSFDGAEEWLLKAQGVLKHTIQTLLLEDEELKSGVKITKEDLKKAEPLVQKYLHQKGERIKKELPDFLKGLEKEIQPPHAAMHTKKVPSNKRDTRMNPGEVAKRLSVPSEGRN